MAAESTEKKEDKQSKDMLVYNEQVKIMLQFVNLTLDSLDLQNELDHGAADNKYKKLFKWMDKEVMRFCQSYNDENAVENQKAAEAIFIELWKLGQEVKKDTKVADIASLFMYGKYDGPDSI